MLEHGFSRRLLPEHEWMLGKNQHTVHFVRLAEGLLAGSTLKDQESAALRKAIDAVKAGELVFKRPITPEEYLKD
jgi:hypothetical protein